MKKRNNLVNSEIKLIAYLREFAYNSACNFTYTH